MYRLHYYEVTELVVQKKKKIPEGKPKRFVFIRQTGEEREVNSGTNNSKKAEKGNLSKGFSGTESCYRKPRYLIKPGTLFEIVIKVHKTIIKSC